MGRIAYKQLLPQNIQASDEAIPVSPLHFPTTAMVMTSGFERNSDGALVFGEEIAASVRLCERQWRYLQLPEKLEQLERRWRLELGVVKGESRVVPGNEFVVAQQPYGQTWIQRTAFKKGSKIAGSERSLFEVPPLKYPHVPVEWLELTTRLDPWEKGDRLIAGISQPHGFILDDPSNTAGDFILGVCPNFDEAVEVLFRSPEIKRLIELTETGRIAYAHPNARNSPPLYDEVKEDCKSAMFLSIEQALAGPDETPDKWNRRPVSDLIDRIYCAHLNLRNRATARRKENAIDETKTPLAAST